MKPKKFLSTLLFSFAAVPLIIGTEMKPWIKDVWVLICIPVKTVKKLNIFKMFAVVLLFWVVQIAGNYQHNNPDVIGNRIIIFFILVVITITCVIIAQESKKL